MQHLYGIRHKIVPGYSPTQEACARALSYGHCGLFRTVCHVVQHGLLDCSLLLLVLRKLECDSHAEMLVMDRGGGDVCKWTVVSSRIFPALKYIFVGHD